MNIDTTDGRSFHKQLDYPKGDPRNPLTDQEIEEKFAALADGVLTSGTQQRVKDAIWNLERIGSVSELMALMESDVRTAKSASHKRKSSRTKGKKNRKPVLA